ncbi:Uncharacterised protein [Clostridium tertium]|uniref:Uncharacterized protein n=1 Tax=Clostridium tertium TaxID=1559 RepID=A0A6N3BAC1_9CLOT
MKSKNTLDPTAPNYKDKSRNKAIKKTPSGESEPSTHTDYK